MPERIVTDDEPKDKEFDAREQTGVSTDSLTAPTNEQRVGHTPGPWRAKWTEDGRCDGIVPDYHNHDGDDCYEGDERCPATDEIVTTDSGHYGPKPADARLIAAAPDLLKALGRSLNWLSSYPGGNAEAAYDEARAAIAKAEGR